MNDVQVFPLTYYEPLESWENYRCLLCKERAVWIETDISTGGNFMTEVLCDDCKESQLSDRANEPGPRSMLNVNWTNQ